MSKLPNATREAMTPEQQKIWDKIHEGRTGGGGPYSMLMHSPEMAQHFAATEDYFRNNSLLPDADREMIILTAAREVEAHYAWTRHEIRAHKVGVKPEVIEAIRAHARSDSNSPAQNKTAGRIHARADAQIIICWRTNCSPEWKKNLARVIERCMLGQQRRAGLRRRKNQMHRSRTQHPRSSARR